MEWPRELRGRTVTALSLDITECRFELIDELERSKQWRRGAGERDDEAGLERMVASPVALIIWSRLILTEDN